MIERLIYILWHAALLFVTALCVSSAVEYYKKEKYFLFGIFAVCAVQHLLSLAEFIFET